LAGVLPDRQRIRQDSVVVRRADEHQILGCLRELSPGARESSKEYQ
jgi:hypothetical protein